jgi:hypothetical protein
MVRLGRMLTLIQLNSMLELHERVLGDLERRDSSVTEQENEARRALEKTLAQCAADRASIVQERTVLLQAQQLYHRFLGSGSGPTTASITQQAPQVMEAAQTPVKVEQLELVAAGAEAQSAAPVRPEAGTLELSGFEVGADFESRIRDLRNDLCNQIIAEDSKPEPKASKWAGPLRGLLATGS